MANYFIQMRIVANSISLATQYNTLIFSPLKAKKAKKILSIPSYMKIYYVATIGYPDYSPRTKYTRELSDIIHFEKYNHSKSWIDEKIIEKAKDKTDMKFLAKGELYL